MDLLDYIINVQYNHNNKEYTHKMHMIFWPIIAKDVLSAVNAENHERGLSMNY